MMHGTNVWSESRCVRKQKYKLIRNFSPNRWVVPPVKMAGFNVQEERPVCELYDLENDPDELNNLAGDEEHRRIRKELEKALMDWMNEVNDPILTGPIRTPYYEMAMEDFTCQ